MDQQTKLIFFFSSVREEILLFSYKEWEPVTAGHRLELCLEKHQKWDFQMEKYEGGI